MTKISDKYVIEVLFNSNPRKQMIEYKCLD